MVHSPSQDLRSDLRWYTDGLTITIPWPVSAMVEKLLSRLSKPAHTFSGHCPGALSTKNSSSAFPSSTCSSNSISSTLITTVVYKNHMEWQRRPGMSLIKIDPLGTDDRQNQCLHPRTCDAMRKCSSYSTDDCNSFQNKQGLKDSSEVDDPASSPHAANGVSPEYKVPDPTTTGQKRSSYRFLDLPREIRDMVYEQLFPHRRNVPRGAMPLRSLIFPRLSRTTLLLANHQTNSEVLDTLYAKSRFVIKINPYDVSFLDQTVKSYYFDNAVKQKRLFELIRHFVLDITWRDTNSRNPFPLGNKCISKYIGSRVVNSVEDVCATLANFHHLHSINVKWHRDKFVYSDTPSGFWRLCYLRSLDRIRVRHPKVVIRILYYGRLRGRTLPKGLKWTQFEECPCIEVGELFEGTVWDTRGYFEDDGKAVR